MRFVTRYWRLILALAVAIGVIVLAFHLGVKSVDTLGWLGWFGYFFGQELPEVLNMERGDTLSEHVWKWFAVKHVPDDRRKFVIARRLLLLASLAWLFAHFVSGGMFPLVLFI